MRYPIASVLGAVALCSSMAAQAEVTQSTDNGFVTKDVALVDASPKEAWLALISPADWWSSEHTWSGDAANLRMTPQAGGCFCEKIPEVDTPERFTLEGSVEHMRVIQAYPESALRMVGALGPLQSEPVTGVLTIALTEVDLPGEPARKGTRIVWEYNVGGSMRYEIPVISKAVDGVMSLQLAGLAQKLGAVDMPEQEKPELQDDGSAEDVSAVSDGESATKSNEPSSAYVDDETAPDEGATIETLGTIGESDEAVEDPEEPEDTGPSVDEAFDDLADPQGEPPLF